MELKKADVYNLVQSRYTNKKLWTIIGVMIAAIVGTLILSFSINATTMSYQYIFAHEDKQLSLDSPSVIPSDIIITYDGNEFEQTGGYIKSYQPDMQSVSLKVLMGVGIIIFIAAIVYLVVLFVKMEEYSRRAEKQFAKSGKLEDVEEIE